MRKLEGLFEMTEITEASEELFEERERRTAHEVLDILDRWSSRLQGHHTQKREYPRKTFRTQITVYIPGTEGLAGECAQASSFQVWARNISQNGLCFIYQGQLGIGEKLILCLDPEADGTHWFYAVLVRSRQVHNEFWEYGVKLTERAEI